MSNELDDLFRQELNGHASEPAADLWARLQARTQADAGPPADAHPVDARFRAGLAGHATPPRRELWERLEDEHLRPRQRRRPVVAWGRLAVAASLLLLVLAGGAGLWWSRQGQVAAPVAVTRPVEGQAAAGATPATTPARPKAVALADAKKIVASQPAAGPAHNQLTHKLKESGQLAVAGATASLRKKNQQISSPRATGLGGFPSSSPVARTAALRRPATAQHPVPGLPKTTPPPDAAAGAQLALGERKPLGNQPTTQPEATALAAAQPQIIEVEVRRGSASRPAATLAAAMPAAAPEAAPRRRFRLGGVLREAGHALRGEPVNLAEATGLPESLTLQAHLGDRTVAKTIRL